MTRSIVSLRIQELAEAKELTFQEISERSGVPVEAIQAYSIATVELTEKLAIDLRDIAKPEVLDVAVVELIEPVVKREAVKLRIRDIARQKGLTLEQLSGDTKINLLLIEFYSEQPIFKEKLTEPKLQNDLNEICKILDCKIEGLLVEVEAEELSETKLRLKELVEERGITLEELSLLTGLPNELIDLMATQPIDVCDRDEIIEVPIKKLVQRLLKKVFPRRRR
jgi:transcriptional regulator with XRE-family HTH domain